MSETDRRKRSREAATLHRQRYPEQSREYIRQWRADNQEKTKEYHARSNARRNAVRESEWPEPIRKKLAARHAARGAKQRGKLVPKPCEKCGTPNVEMHHHDYDKPLDVRWLCKPCHLAEHGWAPTPE